MFITGQRKVAEAQKLAESLFVPRLTFHTSSKVKRSKAKVTRLFKFVPLARGAPGSLQKEKLSQLRGTSIRI